MFVVVDLLEQGPLTAFGWYGSYVSFSFFPLFFFQFIVQVCLSSEISYILIFWLHLCGGSECVSLFFPIVGSRGLISLMFLKFFLKHTSLVVSFGFWYITVQFSHFVSNSLQPQGLQHARLPCPSPIPGVYSNSCPLSRWCHPTISVILFSSRLNLFQHQGLFQWVNSSHQVARVLKLQLQHQSFQWGFRTDFL